MKRKSSLALTVLILVPFVLAAGPRKVELPPYEERTLGNGLKVFVMETHEVPLVTLRLLIPVGSIHDGAGREGEANLTARLLMKGAARMGADEIAEAVEAVGGRLSVDANRDYTVAVADFMSRDLSRAFDLMGKVILKPDFPPDEFEREREILKSEILAEREEPSSIATREFLGVLAGKHPYAHPVNGYRESVSAVTRDDVVDFHVKRYGPSGAVLAVVGDVSREKAFEAAERAFGGWRAVKGEARDIAPLEVRMFPGRRVVVIDRPDLTQSQIRIGNIAVGRSTPDYFPLLVANNALGGGFTSRLMDEIRVNRGLSYGAGSRIHHLRRGGAFVVSTFTKNGTLRETIDVALEQVEKMKKEKLTEKELGSSKQYISGLFPFDLETNGDLAGWLTEIEFFGLPKELAGMYREEVSRVSPDDVMRVAGEHFHTDDCLILVLTNYEEVKDQLEGLGKIEVVDIDEIK